MGELTIKVTICTILCALSSFTAVAGVFALDLNDRWTITRSDGKQVIQGTVPGYVHTALLESGLIRSLDDESIQWVSDHDWVYRSPGFNVPDYMRQQSQLELILDGIDTFAKVYVNGTEVLKANNYFRTWRCDVKSLLQSSDNVIEIHLSSPFKQADSLLAKQDHPLPGDAIRAVARKPQYHYGWDWGPKITPMGIHKSVRLEAWSDFQIRQCGIETLEIEGEKARLRLNIDVLTEGKQTLACNFHFSGAGDEHSYQELISLGTAGGGRDYIKGRYTYEFTIDNPRLWWTHDLGEAFLYDAEVAITHVGERPETAQRAHFKTGIRTIALDEGRTKAGKKFQFILNGVPVFMRGTNYIPVHIFEQFKTKKRKIALLEAALEVNMNMLRVWGGGVYEDNFFYDWCDANGVLIWQDFMYACAMYPGDEDFLENARQEAEEQVERLRYHPSMALWCGNNEVSEGWHRWGWRNGLSKKERRKTWKSYKALFQQLLPEAVERHSELPYHESSPTLGRGDKAHTTRGDAHYWGVWHDAEPFSVFETRIPRFMSEFGFQSMPDVATMRGHWLVGRPDTSLARVRSHQKHPRGFALMDEYMKRMLPPSEDVYRWAYYTQVVQKHGIVKGIRAHRAAQPYCMGTLYWQLNDCWPAISWSSIDFDMRWKALHYALKNSFAPTTVWLEQDHSGQMGLRTVNDRLHAESIDFSVVVFSVDGDTLQHLEEASFRVERGSHWHPLRVEPHDKEEIIWLNFRCNGRSFSEVYHPAGASTGAQAEELQAEKESYPEMNYTLRSLDSLTWEISLSCDEFAFDVQLSTPVPGHFSENYFDLPPLRCPSGRAPVGCGKHVLFTSEIAVDELPISVLAW